MMSASMSPPSVFVWVDGMRCGLLAAAAGERVDDLVGLVFDGRFGLVGARCLAESNR